MFYFKKEVQEVQEVKEEKSPQTHDFDMLTGRI
jgi:hypothetical protein